MFNIPLDYALFMAEQEGYLNTHTSKINRLLKDIKRMRDIGEIAYLELDNHYLAQFGLTEADLNDDIVAKCQKVADVGHV